MLQAFPASAQMESASDMVVAERRDGEELLELGFGGHWKLGHVCPTRVALPSDKVTAVELQTLDGDGVEIAYRKLVGAEEAAKQEIWVPIRIGRLNSELVLRLFEGEEVSEFRYQISDLGVGHSSTQPLVLALGSSMGVEQLARQSAANEESTFTTVVLDDADRAPHNWRDLQACDLLIISASSSELLSELSPGQWDAIETWIRQGGGCIVSLGTRQADLEPLERLIRLLPGPIVGDGRVTQPSALESLVATTEQLSPIGVTLVEPERGNVDLVMADALSRKIPWWISYTLGNGTVRMVASDLGSEPFEKWTDRRLVWARLLKPYLPTAQIDTSRDKQSGVGSYLGYSDLIGQLRATLDVFDSVTVISFGQVAALLIGILILVGPIDYLISVKWLQRPELSWSIAGIMLAACAAGLTWLYATVRPDRVLVNTAQIVDLDSESGSTSGRVWSHVYSGKSRRLTLQADGPLDAGVLLDWQGLPGSGLGGLLSQLNTDRGMPKYSVELVSESESEFKAVGVPAAGTKCFYGTWTLEQNSGVTSELTELSSVDQLQGTVVNPLNVDLRDTVLFYHNWFYVLNSRIPPGASVAISSDMIPKDLSRRLKRVRNVDGNIETTRWDPGSRDELDRLLELMMFYAAASGENYAELSNRYQPTVDLSNALELDRAYLIGRVDEPAVSIQIRDPAGEPVETEVNDRIWYRISIPVQRYKRP